MKFLNRLFGPRGEAQTAQGSPRDPAPGRENALPASAMEQAAREIERLAPAQALVLLQFLRTGLDQSTSEALHYQAAEALTAAVYPKYKFSEYARVFLEDEAFLDYYRRIMDVGNWHSLDRKYTLNQLLRLTLHLDGDVVECGTYKGASALLMCRAHRETGRHVHLFDSFEGLSEPDHRDGEYWTRGALSMPEASVRETLAGLDNYRTYKGWIPERFVEIAGAPIAFLHVDVDLYQPTLDSVAFFYRQIVPGGVILLDDYGFTTCPGATRAADEFFADKPERIAMLPTGQAFTVKQ